MELLIIYYQYLINYIYYLINWNNWRMSNVIRFEKAQPTHKCKCIYITQNAFERHNLGTTFWAPRKQYRNCVAIKEWTHNSISTRLIYFIAYINLHVYIYSLHLLFYCICQFVCIYFKVYNKSLKRLFWKLSMNTKMMPTKDWHNLSRHM